jgi:hypothetical protein
MKNILPRRVSPASSLLEIRILGIFRPARSRLPAMPLCGYQSAIIMRLPKSLPRIFILLACPVLLVVLFYAEEDWRGWHAWEQFKHEWTAKGEKFGSQSYFPALVPDDQNFAMTPLVVSSYGQMIDHTGHEIRPRNTNLVNRLQISCLREADTGDHPEIGSRQKRTLTDLKVWQQYYRNPTRTNSPGYKSDEFPVAANPETPAADVLLALSKYDAVVDELRQASRLPHSRFPLDYDNENPAAILLPHLVGLKRCSQVLQLRAIAELQNDQNDRALEDVKLMLRLADSVRNEPFLISHLVRIAILQISLQPVWEGLTEHKWSVGQLARLNQELSRLDFLTDYLLAMHGEMVFQDGLRRYLRHHPEQLLNVAGDPQASKPDIIGRICLHLVPSGWFFQNQIRCAQAMEEFYLPAADVQHQTIYPTMIRQAEAAVEHELKNVGPFNIMETMMLPALGSAARKFAYAQSSVDFARIACSLERYRIARHQYPESLDGLLPQYLGTLPHDVVGGAPLIYHPRADGQFQLYSVGWNEKDDGGVSAFKRDGSVDTEKGDWTWQ